MQSNALLKLSFIVNCDSLRYVSISTYAFEIGTYLGALVKQSKNSSYVRRVRPSYPLTRNSSTPTGQIYMKCYVSDFY